MARAAARIREASPDILLLQEVWAKRDAEYLARALQPGWISACARHPSGAPKGGLVAFVRTASGWRIRDAPRFYRYRASAPAWKFWEGDGLGRKGVLILDVECGAQQMFLIDTHLQSRYPGKDYGEVRAAQLDELIEVVEKLDRNVPVIIAGDFNTERREPLYRQVAALGTDLTARERGERGTIFDLRDGTREWIDYVVAANAQACEASASLAMIANRGRDDPYSDHDGLLCAITLKRRQAG